jgi:DeoR family ulaG and ulaABCDEF operon transcriptional repressor
MHERERHRIILSAIQEKPVITVQDIAELTEASEATIRRDIASLHVQGKLRRVRGGAEAVHRPQLGNLAARPFRVSESVNIDKKRATPRAAICEEGDHQRGHDDLPDGISCGAPPAGHDHLRTPSTW